MRTLLSRGILRKIKNMYKLYDYQIETINKIQEKKRVLDASTVGTGKTAKALNGAFGSTLIVTLKPLIPQWRREIELWQLDPSRFKVINFESVHKAGSALQFQTMIIDEAHKLKNRKTKNFLNCKRYASQIEYLIMLTGTPLERSPDDLWALLNLIDSKRFKSFWKWSDKHTKKTLDKYGYSHSVGCKNEVALQSEIQDVYIRHTNADIEAPVFIDVDCSPTPKEKKLIDLLLNKEVTILPEFNTLVESPVSRLTFIRQAASNKIPKQDIFLDPIEDTSKFSFCLDLVDQVDKLVIFSNYRSVVERLADKLPGADFYYSGRDQEVIDKFIDGDTKILCATIQSLGVGVNLQIARHCVFYDLPFSSTEYIQSIGRFTRIGAIGYPTIYHLLCEGSRDNYIRKIISDKDKTISLFHLAQEVINLR